MTKRADYDPDLQMVCRPPQDPDADRLTFERWLVSSGRQQEDTVSAAELRAQDEQAHD